MITSELENIRTMAGCSTADIYARWQQAAFSSLPDHSLRRYFNHHLEGISKLSDTLLPHQKAEQSGLLELIGHLHEHYTRFVDPDIGAPVSFRIFMIQKLQVKLCTLVDLLEKEALRQPGTPDIRAYLSEAGLPDKSLRFTYRSLFYLKKLIDHLLEALPAGQSVLDSLLQLNFNHLGYLSSVQHSILAELDEQAAKKEYLQQQINHLSGIPPPLHTSYHPDWPSLHHMLLTWLQELAAALPQNQPVPKKLALNLSVAQLACLVHTANDESVFKTDGTAEILRFFAANCSAKKQANISPGSLSKEYYAISQVTAAVVRDHLLKMAARINRNFFPVWIAAGAAALFF